MNKIKKIATQLKNNKHITTVWYDDIVQDYNTNLSFYFTEQHYTFFNNLNIGNIIKIDQLSLYKDKLFECIINKPHQYHSIIKKYNSKIYQSDIAPELKYINKNKLQFSNNRHVVYYDIQTYYDPQNPDANYTDEAKSPITSIVFYSSLFKSYFTLVWHPEKEVNQKNNKQGFYSYKQNDNQIFICKDETTLLKLFCQMIKGFNVDIITGWYSHGYDLPYIMKRLQKLFKSHKILSPINSTWLGNKRPQDDYYKVRIGGIDSVDMMQVVKSLNYNLQNNKLDTAAEQILGSQYKKYTDATWRDWLTNFDGFLRYIYRDVQILKLIDQKLKCIQYLLQMQILSGVTQLNDIMSVTRLIDSMLINKYWDQIILPNTKDSEPQSYMGGRTIDPKDPGVHRNVMIFDYASLYPTTIMAYNISPQTFLFSKQRLGEIEFNKKLQYLIDNNIHYVDTGQSDQLFGKRYIFLAHDMQIGIIPKLSLQLYQLRKYYKKVAKEAITQSDYTIADKRQYAIKIILNSIYGAMGFRFFRLFVPECADTITYFGRRASVFGQRLLEQMGRVQYIDTDSFFFVKDKNITNQDLDKWLIDYNQIYLKELIREANPYLDIDYFQYNLDYQRQLDYFYVGDKKKRYYSIQKNGNKYVHGLNIIRKDTPKYIKNVLDQLCQKSVKQIITIQDLQEVYTDFVNDTNYQDIAVHRSFSKKFKDYNKTIPQHVRGALYANQYLGLSITHSDVVFLFYINSLCEFDKPLKDRGGVVCLRSQDFNLIKNSDKFQIDYIQLMQKQIIQPLRQFDKIKVVQDVINQWCLLNESNYRVNRNGQYIFKKLDLQVQEIDFNNFK